MENPIHLKYYKTINIYAYLLMSLFHWAPRKKKILKILDHILQQFPAKKFRVVDIGSGPGLLAGVVREKDVDYLGIDNDPEIIKYCNKSFSAIPGFTFSDVNITDSEFQFSRNDIIVLSGIAHHLNDTVLSELLKKALKGSALIISDHTHEKLKNKRQFITSVLQRMDRGSYIRPYEYFEVLEGYILNHSVKFPIKVAGITCWKYFCNCYQPKQSLHGTKGAS